MLNWKHFLSASLSAFLCLFLLLLLILRPTIQGAQAEGEQGVYIDIGMLGDSGESQDTRLANTMKKAPKLVDAVKEAKPPAPVLARSLPAVIEPIQLAQVEVKSVIPIPEPLLKTKEAPEPEPLLKVKEAPEPEPLLKVKEAPEPEPLLKIKEALEPESEILEEPELDVKAETENLDQGPVSALNSDPDPTGNDSISQLKMSTGSGTSSALAGGVQGKTRYANMIKAMIASKNTYPKASRKRGETGTVVIQVSISHLGSLIEVKIIQSSGKKRLDRASIKAVKRAAPFPASSHLAKGELFISRMPIEYKLH